jgi:hypothetical protein
MAMQSNGVGTVDTISPILGGTPSTHGFYLVNPNDVSQLINNSDIVPAGTGPSNASSGGTVDPYWQVLY